MRIREGVATFRGHRVPNIDFLGKKKWWFGLSGLFIVLSLFGLIFNGLNFSIDFRGGALLQYTNSAGASVGEIQSTLAQYGRGDATVEILGENQVQIRTSTLTTLGLRADQLRGALARQAGISANDINEQDVGPTWGGTISRKAVVALVVFLVLVALYISFRFEPKMAGGAVVALLHDLLITAGIYALVGREVTPETVIAVLTILGYSLYDTVVIFDKVKENTESPALVARDTYGGVVNASLNQVFMRSVNTSLTTLLPIGALLWFGGPTLKDFAFALFIGIASGTYSSIFVATPVLAIFKEREPRYRQIKARAQVRAARPGEPVAGAPSGRGSKELESAGVSARPGREGEPAALTASGQRPSATPPRPRPAGSAAQRKKKKPQGKPKRRRR